MRWWKIVIAISKQNFALVDSEELLKLGAPGQPNQSSPWSLKKGRKSFGILEPKSCSAFLLFSSIFCKYLTKWFLANGVKFSAHLPDVSSESAREVLHIMRYFHLDTRPGQFSSIRRSHRMESPLCGSAYVCSNNSLDCCVQHSSIIHCKKLNVLFGCL